ncbi:MAG: TIGR02996 domain-containing protein [Planctomycetia bacterium]|nr:TIGR02996 domain-containing protein [Planctomycetia bacterium]
MCDEAALLKAIIAHPGEDTPRLAYADWLQENEGPIQAEFIRLQCRLASCSASDPDYPDLLERYAEVVAQFQMAVKLTVPQLPPGFTFNGDTNYGAENFRRGFLSSVTGEWDTLQMDPSDEEVEQFAAGLSQLVATTTARELDLSVTPEQLARILAAPGAEALTGLGVAPSGYLPETGDDALRVLANAKSTAGLERLSLYMRATTPGLRALAEVKFQRLWHLDLPMLAGSVRDLAAVTETKWFHGLRSVRTGSSSAPLESALVRSLAKLPNLDSLDFRCTTAGARKALGTSRGFPALAKLSILSGRLTAADVTQLAKAQFPRLTELSLYNPTTAALTPLLSAKWFAQLRVLALTNGRITDKGIVALSKCAAAKNLRILRLGETPLGMVARAALADGTRFPNLTTLDIDSHTTRNAKPQDMAKFAEELSLPQLRHLYLSGWSLGDAGAKALAANPMLANVTRLMVRSCGIGEKGLTALVRSAHLQQLIELDISYNTLKKATALLDTTRLPRLATVKLEGNPFSQVAREKLHRARGWIA